MLYFLVNNFLRQMTCYCKCLLGYEGWHNYYVRHRQHIFTIKTYSYSAIPTHEFAKFFFTYKAHGIHRFYIIEIHMLTMCLHIVYIASSIALINWLSCLWTCV